MEYIIKSNNILLKQEDFSLSETLDCGQAFRWTEIKDENGYCGFSGSNFLKITKEKDHFVLHNTTEEQFQSVWLEYFDFGTDYSELKRRFSEDETLKKACDFAGGIRLLKQNSWEALCSFIISQNNNIPRIKGIIERLCVAFGEETENGFTFPTAERLADFSAEELSPLRAGFRARYICDASKKISSHEIVLEEVSKLPLENAKKELMKICGVGTKVADCALLYGMYRIEAFPVDVWIKRVMAEYYPNGLPECVKGAEGIAQQYLFHYIRNLKKMNF